MDSGWRQEVGLLWLLFSHWTPGLWGPLSTLLWRINGGLEHTSLSRHRPENDLPSRHTLVTRCKITDPETHHKFLRGEQMTHAHYHPEPTLNQIWGQRLGFGAVGYKIWRLPLIFPFMAHTDPLVLVRDTVRFSSQGMMTRTWRCCTHTASMGEWGGNWKTKCYISSSTFGLCGSGAVTSPLWVCCFHLVVINQIRLDVEISL